MSENKKKNVKVIPIAEDNLVNLIDNIVSEAVEVEKKKWIAEQAAKDNKEKSSLMERVAKLEKILSNATVTKKAK
jgi:hypothetical protein